MTLEDAIKEVLVSIQSSAEPPTLKSLEACGRLHRFLETGVINEDDPRILTPSKGG